MGGVFQWRFIKDWQNCLCLSFSQDAQIEREKQVYNITGGCTALTVVYLLGKLYVGNAGDSRCVCTHASKWKGSVNDAVIITLQQTQGSQGHMMVVHEHAGAKKGAATNPAVCSFEVACTLLFFVYICRAIIIRNNEIIPMSSEFTPESERQRLQFLVRKHSIIHFYIKIQSRLLHAI